MERGLYTGATVTRERYGIESREEIDPPYRKGQLGLNFPHSACRVLACRECAI